ncbi:hypothetical protein CLAFUW4_03906 [Fulvia fulva]|uniref:Uncharacterized protein n=1 Tax=Passalora fulva TaxID=5499 RepID=A0A9Q8L9I4_PASFU|nr:uncharacterized protein CLAFUR5_03875 [Fulvia fulva]KAK4632200.1 hypothetical protein CLAFUR4_03894 [Fulvia fulva]KAK4633622.1 hypothetical protein CLAFUR0_03893 [Fulvia fulva]UJO13327.1 hypothetical protein CLAFUR5_03875 [Fulvia fulva]WPV11170.1 hypothetical protein CLAFUW4_03906 [Fulvia fulva]WPV26515.1 hypothetical protein CLAFUW7_03897 [Fulvia fulva]
MASTGLAKAYFEKLQEAERQIFELTETVAERDKQWTELNNSMKTEDGCGSAPSKDDETERDLRAQLNAPEREANHQD